MPYLNVKEMFIFEPLHKYLTLRSYNNLKLVSITQLDIADPY